MNEANAPIVRTRLDLDQPFTFEGSQNAAHVSGIQAEPGSQLPDLGPLEADLPQRPRFHHRPAAPEKPIVQRADSLGDGAVEGAHGAYGWPVHVL